MQETPINDRYTTHPPDPAARRALFVRLQAECPTLSAFLDHAAGRLPVVPLCTPNVNQRGCQQHGPRCEKPGKTPLVPWKRYQLGPPAPAAEVTQWRRRWPTANWALAAGPASGLVLLDRDGDDAAPLDFAETVRQRTGRPGGWHYLFACPEGVTLKNTVGFRPGWDVRAQGGLLILPGSLHPSGRRYELDRASLAHGLADLPTGLLTTLSTPARASVSISGDGGTESAPAHGRLDLGAVLGGVAEGQRDDTLFRAVAALHRAGVPQPWAERLALEAAAACRPPFPPDVAREKVQRVYGAPPEESGEWVPRAQLDQERAAHAETRLALAAATRELTELKRQQPTAYAERMARAIVQTESDSTTRGTAALFAEMLAERARLRQQAVPPPHGLRIPWCNKQRAQQLGWKTNAQKMGTLLHRAADTNILTITDRQRGTRAGDYRVEQFVELAADLPDDFADALSEIQRRLKQPAPPRKVAARKAQAPCTCNADRCAAHPDAATIATISRTCAECGAEATAPHSHAPQQPARRSVFPVVAFRRAPVASDGENLQHTYLKKTAGDFLHHSHSVTAPSGETNATLIDAALAAFEQARAQHPRTAASPAATVAAQLAALQAVAQAAQAPPWPLAVDAPPTSDVCPCGQPSGGRRRCPSCQAAWLKGVPA